MKTTAEFFETFKRHGLTVPATHVSGGLAGTQTPLDVVWAAPGELVLEDVASTDRSITFPTSALATIRPGDRFVIDGETYHVRSALPRPGTDGSEWLVGLKKHPAVA